MSYTDEQIDWMRHGALLLVDIVYRPAHRTALEIARLRAEVELRNEVLTRIATNKVREGKYAAMEVYMRALADLEIARYGKQIDEPTFFACSGAARASLREYR